MSSARDESQITVIYQPTEDRLLLRTCVDNKDARIWLTRRMTVQWLQAVDQVLTHVADLHTQPAEHRRAISEFRRDAAVQDTDFSRPYAEEGLTPYPEDGPLLVIKLNIKASKNGDVALIFAGESTQAIQLSLSEREMHALMHMVNLAATKAEWELDPHGMHSEPDPIRIN